MINLKDKLSHLTFRGACKLLGPEGERLIRTGGRYDIDISEEVVLRRDQFQLNLDGLVITIRLDSGKDQRLDCQCSLCTTPCEHIGAALSLILEEKLVLGLSAPPPERVPVESLSDEELVKQAIMDRAERARTEKMTVTSMNQKELWTDYTVTNSASGKTYRVALRGWDRGQSFCSCPDYQKNTLGTCKHVIHVLDKAKGQFSRDVCTTPYKQKNTSIYMQYGEELELRLLTPEKMDPMIAKLVEPVEEKSIEDVRDLLRRIKAIEDLGEEVIIFPDAEEHMGKVLYHERVEGKIREIRKTILSEKTS